MGKGGDASAATGGTAKKFTWKEIQQHRTPDDAWVVHNNKVYDVSSWHEHPGGAVIFTHAGDDMTDIFAAFHAGGSHNLMGKFYIGDLIPETRTGKTDKQAAFEKGYRDLRSQLVLMGLFKSNPWFYAYKCASNMLLWAAGMVLMTSDSSGAHFLSAFLLGLFFQQCGWLAHDFLHHQVFRKRKYGDLAGLYWGNLMQGCKSCMAQRRRTLIGSKALTENCFLFLPLSFRSMVEKQAQRSPRRSQSAFQHCSEPRRRPRH